MKQTLPNLFLSTKTLVYARRHGAVTNEALQSLRGLSSAGARSVLQDLVTRELLQTVGRGRGTRYVLGELALRARRRANLGEQVKAIVAHARRYLARGVDDDQ